VKLKDNGKSVKNHWKYKEIEKVPVTPTIIDKKVVLDESIKPFLECLAGTQLRISTDQDKRSICQWWK
jgi:hypothetical protein